MGEGIATKGGVGPWMGIWGWDGDGGRIATQGGSGA